MRTLPLIFLVTICLTGCHSVPITDRTQLMLTTSGYENNLGEEAYAEYKQEYKTSTNAEYNAALLRCGNAIKAVANKDDFKWEFVVLDSPIQNAFCLPGGKVAVYTGLLDIMNNEAELACVVGHEVAHAIARHGGERMSWGTLQTLGAIGLSLGFGNEIIDGIYGTGSQIGVMLPFSRSNEKEADLIGLILMAKAGYNPQAAVQFWTRFGKDAKSGVLGSFLSTHPAEADRINDLNSNMSRAEAEYKKVKNPAGFGVTFRK